MILEGPERYDAITDSNTPITKPEILHAIMTINDKIYHIPSNTLAIYWNSAGHWNVHHNFIYYDTDNVCLSPGYWGLETDSIIPTAKNELLFSAYLSTAKINGDAKVTIILNPAIPFELPTN
jgi:hypothetical protein